jgi:hypothetical protein
MMCGDCSKKNGLTLEQRMELALSGVEGEKYSCSVCFKLKEVKKISGVRVGFPKAATIEKPIPTPTEKPKKKEPIQAEYEQLSFFDTSDHIAYRK